MHEVRTSALWAGRRPWPAVWGGLLGEQTLWLVRLSRQASVHSVRVQAVEQAHNGPSPEPNDSEMPWWAEHLQRIAQPRFRLPWPLFTRGPLALAWPQARCRQGVLSWPGASDAPALLAEVHLEAAAALGMPPAEVGFDFQVQAQTPLHMPVQMPVQMPLQMPLQMPPETQVSRPSALLVNWAAAPRTDLLAGQRRLRALGWRVPHIEPEALAVRRAAECLLGEPALPWAVPVRDWQFARRSQRSVPEPTWRALQDSPHWGPLAACGAALAVMA